MPIFSYSARNLDGQLVRGVEDAESSEICARRLDEKGLSPVKIEEKKETVAAGGFFKGFSISAIINRPGGKDLVIFTRQLGALLGAGITLLAALKSLEKQTQNKYLKSSIVQMQLDIQGGITFSATLKKFPNIFPNYYTEMVVTGEISGTLIEVLSRLATMLEDEEVTRSRIVMATRYPLLVIILIIMALVFMIYFVIPKFTSMFSTMHAQLPLPTRILIGVSTYSQRYWYLAIMVVAGLIFSYRMYAATEKGRERLDGLTLKMPVFGPLMSKILISRLCQILGMMINSGIPINQALLVISRALSNKVFEKAIKSIQESVLSGYSFSEPLGKTGLFPPMVVQMISVGEESGEMELMLHQVVDYYQLEIDSTLKNFVTLIEPFLIVFLAGIVLVLALGIFMPMWNLLEVYSKGAF